MRRIRYSVAMSLDGYIAGPNGEYDWIEVDPSAAGPYFKAFYAQAAASCSVAWRPPVSSTP
jgi:dihydrofolate reductase